MIEISDMRFRYDEGEFRLSVPDLRVENGERVAVVGPSGSGKTTLLNLIAGISQPQSGDIVTAGQKLTELDDGAVRNFRIENIGLVFQEFELLEYLDVLDNVLLPYRINSSLKLTDDVRQRAADLLESVGIGDMLDRYPDQLSQGERQRVAVCRALLVKPSLLLADEPTGNLDERATRGVFQLLRDINATGTAVLMATHNLELVRQTGYRTIELQDGTLVFDSGEPRRDPLLEEA